MPFEFAAAPSDLPIVDAGTGGAIGCASRFATGNVPLLLAEIRHALERLMADGTTHALDLKAIPLGPGEEDAVLAALGRGELRAELDSYGPTEIQECAYPGVWCVTHRNTAGQIVGRFIEITCTPALLASPPEDVRAGLERLTAELAAQAA